MRSLGLDLAQTWVSCSQLGQSEWPAQTRCCPVMKTCPVEEQV